MELQNEKKLGFGFMRLPTLQGDIDHGGEADIQQICQMVDHFIAEGFSYFDTAFVYADGRAEDLLNRCLVQRHPRSAYQITDKLTASCFSKEEDIRPFFESQLQRVGVEYFDTYLMHSVFKKNYGQFTSCRAFEIAKELKAEGKIRRLGISFHDKAEFLEQILSEHPEIEVVQIQLNYADWDHPAIESGAVYEVCRRFGKPILVMEPVKGGNLVNLPEKAKGILDALQGGSYASYAIRFAASLEGVEMVLSGMSTLQQVQDNVSYMKDFKPLQPYEQQALQQVKQAMEEEQLIACTNCRYCVPDCPKDILIPALFACLNTFRRYGDWQSHTYYRETSQGHGIASDCIGCGQCERTCPQHLPIPQLLKSVAEVFDENPMF